MGWSGSQEGTDAAREGESSAQNPRHRQHGCWSPGFWDSGFQPRFKNVISPIHQHTQRTREDHWDECWAGGCMPINSALAFVLPEQKPQAPGQGPWENPSSRWWAPGAAAIPLGWVLSGAHLFHEPPPLPGPDCSSREYTAPSSPRSRGCSLTFALFTPLAPTWE